MSCLLEVDILMCSVVTPVLLFTRWTLMAALLPKFKGEFFLTLRVPFEFLYLSYVVLLLLIPYFLLV